MGNYTTDQRTLCKKKEVIMMTKTLLDYKTLKRDSTLVRILVEENRKHIERNVELLSKFISENYVVVATYYQRYYSMVMDILSKHNAIVIEYDYENIERERECLAKIQEYARERRFSNVKKPIVILMKKPKPKDYIAESKYEIASRYLHYLLRDFYVMSVSFYDLY